MTNSDDTTAFSVDVDEPTDSLFVLKQSESLTIIAWRPCFRSVYKSRALF